MANELMVSGTPVFSLHNHVNLLLLFVIPFKIPAVVPSYCYLLHFKF